MILFIAGIIFGFFLDKIYYFSAEYAPKLRILLKKIVTNFIEKIKK